MLLNVPTFCWQRCTSFNIYSQSSQLQGRLTQRMALWNTSHSQAVRCRAKIQSSDLQNATCSVRLGQRLQCGVSRDGHILNVKSDIPLHQKFSSISWNLGSVPWKIVGTASGLCFAVSGMANAEGPVDNNTETAQPTESATSSAHGKKVYTDYSVTGIPGDGRCLFRSVAHGACIRSGKPIPNEDLQKKLADELRTMVADEFIKWRAETEWFVEGDFDTYVSRIRKPHVWGGEPELFMASHVLRMPITVYMHDEEAGGLIAIAEYGQEYGTEAPIQVLYHGYGHYDALHIPAQSGPRSRL
ncbi:hypothetical protein ACP70R_007071 [Stipagrostis hirtigluma subsp. patula]